MGRLKEIREKSPEWMKMSLMDLVESMDPTLNNKYVQMIVNIIISKMESNIKSISQDGEFSHIINEYHSRVPSYTKEFIESIPKEKIIMLTRLCDVSPFGYNDFRDISDFISRHMNNKFFGVDVNKIKTIKELQLQNSIASIKEIEKEMENQVFVVLNNDNWLAIRPITYESSLKYGATTKWCTTSRDNYYHFFRYTESGKLVYIINKKTGEKTAMFAGYSPQTSGYEISFWNQTDDRVDSLMTNLDSEIMDVLRNIIKDDTESNKSLNSEMWLESKRREETKEMVEKVSSGGPPIRLRRMVLEDPIPMEEPVMEEPEMEESWEMDFAEEVSMGVAETLRAAVVNYNDHMDNRPMTTRG